MSNVVKLPGPPAPPRCAVPIGQTSYGALELDLARVLAGRMLVQGGSGAGKSQTMRRIVEEAFDYVQTMIVDPEGRIISDAPLDLIQFQDVAALIPVDERPTMRSWIERFNAAVPLSQRPRLAA